MINALVGFFVSMLMGMGVGGGGLFVIFLTLYLNFQQINAQGTNLAFFVLSALASLFIHVRKRKINVKQLLTMASFGILGSLIFSYLANFISSEIPRRVLGGLLIYSGASIIFKEINRKKKNIF